MRYYTVAVADAAYKGDTALTYASEEDLLTGSLVLVPLRKMLVTGIIMSQTPKPHFTAKLISEKLDVPTLPIELLDVLSWIQQYYSASLGVVTQQVIPGSITAKNIIIPEIQTFNEPHIATLPALTQEQQTALQTISSAGTSLIHGNTGTGKTRLYIEKTRQSISKNKSVLVLTPEISLTSQLFNSFKAVFGNRVFVTHSGLTNVQRRKIWLQLLHATEPVIVIGPRSTLFSPIRNIGLIVVDEFHEDAYKQIPQPSYHAVHVAAVLAARHKASVLLGSATPPVTEYYQLEQKNRPIVRLTEPAKKSSYTTTITTVNMSDRTLFTQNKHLSNPLLSAIREQLASGKQSLLFLNRRGSARTTLCSNCGWHATCDHCGTALTLHEDDFVLRCHTCNRKKTVPNICPICSGNELLFQSAGTKAIETAVKHIFPSARVMRFDTDNKKTERFEAHYDAIKSGDIDILIGTQLIAKGIDLPKLSVVGIVNADLSLQIPDFTAEEKTYQLLSQVLGRVGRGHGNGQVFIQSYAPENSIIQTAITRNWDTFYSNELAQRKAFNFPPYKYLLLLMIKRTKPGLAEKNAHALLHKLQQNLNLFTEGPTPSYTTKIAGKEEWRLVVKSSNRSLLLSVVKELPSGWKYILDPTNLL